MISPPEHPISSIVCLLASINLAIEGPINSELSPCAPHDAPSLPWPGGMRCFDGKTIKNTDFPAPSWYLKLANTAAHQLDFIPWRIWKSRNLDRTSRTPPCTSIQFVWVKNWQFLWHSQWLSRLFLRHNLQMSVPSGCCHQMDSAWVEGLLQARQMHLSV